MISDHTLAPEGTLCVGSTPYSGSKFACELNNGAAEPAAHIWEGRTYCVEHSPFDLTEGERMALKVREAQARQAEQTKTITELLEHESFRYPKLVRALVVLGWDEPAAETAINIAIAEMYPNGIEEAVYGLPCSVWYDQATHEYKLCHVLGHDDTTCPHTNLLHHQRWIIMHTL